MYSTVFVFIRYFLRNPQYQIKFFQHQFPNNLGFYERNNSPWFKFSQLNLANRILARICPGHSKHPLPTTQEKTLYMDITRWSILKSDWLYYLQPKMEKLYTVSKNNTGSWLWLRSWTPYCQIQTSIEESRENH